MNRTVLALALGLTLTAACGGSDDTSTDATPANGAGATAGAAGTGGDAGAAGTAGQAGAAGEGGSAGIAGGGQAGASAGAGGETAGSGGKIGSQGGPGSGTPGGSSCPSAPSPGGTCTQTCEYAAKCAAGCPTKTVCACANGKFSCQFDPMDACYPGACQGPKGGSGGGGSGGTGGAPPVACPSPGAACTPELECATSSTVTICDAGVAWQGVDTGAKSSPTCDPTGVWKLTYPDPALPAAFCSSPSKINMLAVKTAPSGKLLASFGSATASTSIDTTTCTITATYEATFSGVTDTTAVTLTVAGNTATGTYTLGNAGACNATTTGPLTATRD